MRISRRALARGSFPPEHPQSSCHLAQKLLGSGAPGNQRLVAANVFLFWGKRMKLFFHGVMIFASLASAAFAEPTVTSLTVTEMSPVYDANNVECVPLDYPTGFGMGS